MVVFVGIGPGAGVDLEGGLSVGGRHFNKLNSSKATNRHSTIKALLPGLSVVAGDVRQPEKIFVYRGGR